MKLNVVARERGREMKRDGTVLEIGKRISESLELRNLKPRNFRR